MHRWGWHPAFPVVWNEKYPFPCDWDVQCHYPLFFLCLFTKQKVEEKHNTKWKSIDVSGMASPVKIWIDKRAKTVKKIFLKSFGLTRTTKMFKSFESVQVPPMALCFSYLWTILYKADSSFPDPGKNTDSWIWNSNCNFKTTSQPSYRPWKVEEQLPKKSHFAERM